MSRQWALLLLYAFANCRAAHPELIHVYGYEGRDAEVPCPCPPGYEHYTKYLCRGHCGAGDVLIETIRRAQRGRYSVVHDPLDITFTVTISNLSMEDDGTYLCGIHRSVIKDLYPGTVRLRVAPDRCCDGVNTTVQGHVDSSVSVHCPYPSHLQLNPKYLCRGLQPSTCLQQAAVTSNRNHSGRFRLHDDRAAGVFTVTISRLTREDAGMYLCGVNIGGSLDRFSALQIEVKDAEHRWYVVIIVSVAVLIGTLVIVCRCKCKKKQDTGVNVHADACRTTELQLSQKTQEQPESQDDIYINLEAMAVHTRPKSYRQDRHNYDNEGGEENTAAQDIYCNQVIIDCNKP